jgi:hypothetical protein
MVSLAPEGMTLALPLAPVRTRTAPEEEHAFETLTLTSSINPGVCSVNGSSMGADVSSSARGDVLVSSVSGVQGPHQEASDDRAQAKAAQ